MFPPTYFSPSYFPSSYFPGGGTSPPSDAIAYFPPSYFAPSYFAPSYFPSAPPSITTTLDFRASLVAQLKTYVALAAVINGRIFPGVVPQDVDLGTSPSLTFQVITIPRAKTLDGPGGIADATVQIGISSKIFSDCVAGVQALWPQGQSGGLKNFKGPLGGGVIVVETQLEDEREHYDQPDDGSDFGTYQIQQDYKFRFRE
jgi:hypothetical protein